MAHWVLEEDQFCLCSKCRYVWDDIIDHVSDMKECPNCGAAMEKIKYGDRNI